MATIGELVVELKADTAKLRADMNKAAEAVKGSAKRIEGHTMAMAGAMRVLKVATAAALVGFSSDRIARFGIDILKSARGGKELATALGDATQAAQEYVATGLFGNVTGTAASMRRLTESIREQTAALRAHQAAVEADPSYLYRQDAFGPDGLPTGRVGPAARDPEADRRLRQQSAATQALAAAGTVTLPQEAIQRLHQYRDAQVFATQATLEHYAAEIELSRAMARRDAAGWMPDQVEAYTIKLNAATETMFHAGRAADELGYAVLGAADTWQEVNRQYDQARANTESFASVMSSGLAAAILSGKNFTEVLRGMALQLAFMVLQAQLFKTIMGGFGFSASPTTPIPQSNPFPGNSQGLSTGGGRSAGPGSGSSRGSIPAQSVALAADLRRRGFAV